MRGKVLSFNDTSGRGLISGEDGQRYTFMRASLEDGLRTIRPGVDVDFQVSDGEATGIYVVPGGYVIGDKNKIIAALLAFPFFVGCLGVHKFYLGKQRAGVIMLLMGTVGWLLVLPGIAVWLIAFIEFIVYLIKSDQQFYEDYVIGDREWF
jgi:TM2 domain-containing membrane protein YozV/cold shock CspA family protein